MLEGREDSGWSLGASRGPELPPAHPGETTHQGESPALWPLSDGLMGPREPSW